MSMIDAFVRKATQFSGEQVRSFAIALASELVRNIDNKYIFGNSLDYYSKEDKSKEGIGEKQYKHFIRMTDKEKFAFLIDRFIHECHYKSLLYQMLKDDQSRDLLTRIALYKILGHTQIKMPYYRDSNKTLRRILTNVSSCEINDLEIDKLLENTVKDESDIYHLFDLRKIGLDMQLLSCEEEIFRHFFAPSYTYLGKDENICAEQGDTILDCGACLCDTALFFALKTGARGRVICFEPMPNNIHLAKFNLQMNPWLAERITLVEAGTSDTNQEQQFTAWGPSSNMQQREGLSTVTVSLKRIDDVVGSLGVRKVDFIKMDIEGAELAALQGAEQTIRKFKPKLAICLYHKPQDFYEIPLWLSNLDLGYRFYLGHHHVNAYETVLYAKVTP